MNNFNHVCVSHKMNFLSRLTKNENRENKIESLGRVDCPFFKSLVGGLQIQDAKIAKSDKQSMGYGLAQIRRIII